MTTDLTTDVLSLDALRAVLLAAAGEPEGFDLNGDIADVAFEEMGYDSLALLETGSRIERRFGISLGDDLIAASPTPRTLLEAINRVLAEQEIRR